MREIFSVDTKSSYAHSELSRLCGLYSSRTSGCGLRLVKDSRSGFAFATSPRLLPKDIAMTSDFHGFGQDGRSVFHDSTEFSPAELVDMVRSMLSELDGVFANFVGANFSSSRRSIKNPQLSLSETTTLVTAQAFVSTPTSVGFDYVSSRKRVPFRKAARRAKEMALASQDPVRPRVGRMSVTFSPKAVASLMDLVTDALSANEVLAGRSHFEGKLNQTVSSLKIVDDPLKRSGTSSRGFDDEGSRCKKKTLINKTLKSFLHTVETAGRLGGAPGNASRNYSSLPEADSTNINVSGPRGSRGELFVEWLSGTHTIPPSGDFSIEAKNAFQDGFPVSGLMVSGNLFDMLKDVTVCGRKETFENVTTRSWTAELDVIA